MPGLTGPAPLGSAGCGTPASIEVRNYVIGVTIKAWRDAHPGCDIADAEACLCARTVLLVPTCPTYAPTVLATWPDEPDVGPVVSFRTGRWPRQVPYDGGA